MFKWLLWLTLASYVSIHEKEFHQYSLWRKDVLPLVSCQKNNFLKNSEVSFVLTICLHIFYLWSVCDTHTCTCHICIEKQFNLPHLGPTFSLVKLHENLAVFIIAYYVYYLWWSIAKCSSDYFYLLPVSVLCVYKKALHLFLIFSVINYKLNFEIYKTW